MPQTLLVKARDEKVTVFDPHNMSRRIPHDRFIDVRLSSQTARLVKQGVLIRKDAERKPEPVKKARKAPEPIEKSES